MFLVNGDVIVTLLPVNTKFPWITPARFRPELVPEELMAQGLTVRNNFLLLPVCLLPYTWSFMCSKFTFKTIVIESFKTGDKLSRVE